MSARNFWLVVLIWCVLLGLLMTCAGRVGDGGATAAGPVGQGDPDVDLEAVLSAYKSHVSSGAQDLTAFESAVNLNGWYTGGGAVSVRMQPDGAVVGFVDGSGDGAYTAGADKLVFTIEADHNERQLYASDRHHNRYRIGAGNILTYYLVGRMLGGHRGYYGGYRRYGYRGFHTPGYYRRYRSTGGWGSRLGSRRTSGGRSYGGGWGRSSGGWGGGK